MYCWVCVVTVRLLCFVICACFNWLIFTVKFSPIDVCFSLFYLTSTEPVFRRVWHEEFSLLSLYLMQSDFNHFCYENITRMYKLFSTEETTYIESQNCLRFVTTDCGQKLLWHKIIRLSTSFISCNYDFTATKQSPFISNHQPIVFPYCSVNLVPFMFGECVLN